MQRSKRKPAWIANRSFYPHKRNLALSSSVWSDHLWKQNDHNGQDEFEDLLWTLNLVGIFPPLEIPQSDVLLGHPGVVVRPVPLPAPGHNDDFGKCDQLDGHGMIEVWNPNTVTSSWQEGSAPKDLKSICFIQKSSSTQIRIIWITITPSFFLLLMMLMVMMLVVVILMVMIIMEILLGELPATDISHCIDAQIGPSFRSQLANYWNRSITDANTLNEKKNVILNVKISAGKKIFPHNFPNLE